ncbi:uncharacterized protein LOC119132628 isoform X3 [Syngnathus acus]|uniref:uncharacterized protein LOC119132628 isoform X3 n=1 Tax=Syngnathus acus TaxID=161584 RepID=UPI0018862D39|nr:uncharacterized protein LOC119132628 isoform X3 [Syngnathus acus]
MERSRAAYFTHEEQSLIMEGYDEYKEMITAKSNTVAANKAREECWQKIADRVNKCGTSIVKRTWQQIKIKHKNIIQSANRKKNEMRKTGVEPAPASSTASEELDLSNNEGCPIIEGIEGAFQSDPSAGSSQHHLYVQVEGETVVLLEPPVHVPHKSSPKGEGILHHSPQPTASTARQTKRQIAPCQVADTIRALYKRNLELDNLKKELEIKKLKLEILELKTKHMETCGIK